MHIRKLSGTGRATVGKQRMKGTKFQILQRSTTKQNNRNEELTTLIKVKVFS